jgi:nickel/cobalt transporter (NicO) family protein
MDFNALLQQGTAQAWLYFPVAILLGALHGLEPGHSKTMMAAFIIAVRGTIMQAALLGLAAAISHSLVIWALAALALTLGSQWNVETAEPYFQMGTGVIVIGMAIWTLWRIRKSSSDHHHHHHDDVKSLSSPDGAIELSIFEDGVLPRFRIAVESLSVEPAALRTLRPDGTVQDFSFMRVSNFWESNETIPEPHEFHVEAKLRGASGEHTVAVAFAEHHHHDDDEEDDEHARQHAEQIRRRFDGREVTTPQIVLFGLTGGLMPCPAALSILLICLQLKEFTLGFSLVAAFSFGLALTLVTVGVVAAWGIREASKRSGFINRMARRAPYVSSIFLIILGVVFFARGVWHFV